MGWADDLGKQLGEAERGAVFPRSGRVAQGPANWAPRDAAASRARGAKRGGIARAAQREALRESSRKGAAKTNKKLAAKPLPEIEFPEDGEL